MAEIDRTELARLLDAERAAFAEARPASRAAAADAAAHLIGGVPMTWINPISVRPVP